MADVSAPNESTPLTRSKKTMSEALLNEKWDRCLSSVLVRSSVGAAVGIVFSVLLFRRRAWPAFVGLGFGAGRAWEECDNSFRKAAAPTSDGLRVIRT